MPGANLTYVIVIDSCIDQYLLLFHSILHCQLMNQQHQQQVRQPDFLNVFILLNNIIIIIRWINRISIRINLNYPFPMIINRRLNR